MFNKKGQGTIEYLIIIAIVVVIALVVVSLLLDVMGNTGGVSQTQAQTAWRSSEPWAIVEWSLLEAGNLTVVLRNNSFETLGFNEFGISTNDTNDLASNVAPGGTLVRTISGLTGYTSGNTFSILRDDIFIDYNSGNINNRRQYGAADIVGIVQ